MAARAVPEPSPDQLVADLVWVAESPSFVSGADCIGSMPFDPEVVDSDHLASFMATRVDGRVGRYFEALVHYWLEYVRGVDMLAVARQIRIEGRTIGELDFVFVEPDGTVCHWEVASKFYLHVAGRAPSAFPGPNTTDNFETKITHLFERQLPLSREHAAEVVERGALVRGCLFLHANAYATGLRRLSAGDARVDLPDRMNANCTTGIWLRSSEIELLSALEPQSAVTTSKPFWFSPRLAAHADMHTLAASLHAHFRDSRRAVMGTLVDERLPTGTAQFCVVDDSWDRR